MRLAPALVLAAALAACDVQPAEEATAPAPVVRPVAIATPTPAPTPKVVAPTATPASRRAESGQEIVAQARRYVGITELPGNRGPEIDKWNRLAGVPVGSPYCASFAGAMHREAGAPTPKGYAWSPAWFEGSRRVAPSELRAGDVVGYFYPQLGRIGHVGIFEGPRGAYVATIEANTSYDARAGSAADREGDGVHAKLRNAKLLAESRNRFARYWR